MGIDYQDISPRVPADNAVGDDTRTNHGFFPARAIIAIQLAICVQLHLLDLKRANRTGWQSGDAPGDCMTRRHRGLVDQTRQRRRSDYGRDWCDGGLWGGL